MSKVALVVSDLLFQSRIDAAVRAKGHEPVVIGPLGVADASLADLVIVDAHEKDLDVGSLIRSAKASGARVLVFGRHTEPETLRSARQAGADKVVARSQLAEELPQLIDSLLQATMDKRASHERR